ncbi:uncharacterized protein LOC114292876 [Camellia sinensis]|uniref:uncharacterized protein LOC114292876 n=1 Tax=Camellia sinensis TaxID=4442 RepID=UPI0010356A56|nr:uncharacterized protein LOC114292876 [Camellia sinensis]
MLGPTTSSYPTLATDSQANSVSLSSSRGRGFAKGIKDWGTDKKLAIDFDANFNPTGDNESKLTSQLGFMVLNGNIVSLTYVDRIKVPIDVLESIWADVKDNLQICLEGYKPRCLKKYNDLWKDHESKIKNKYFEPNKDHTNMKDMVPPQTVPEQWYGLVDYWNTKKVEMIAEGLPTDKLSVWKYTRNQN